jgi:DNA invertase Pin-like site-specific DNA recombinase
LCDNCHGLIHSVSYSNGIISHSELTKIGIETARRNGKQIGLPKGTKLKVKKEALAKEAIRKYSKDFDGTLNNVETMKLAGVSQATYYKYKRELRRDLNA